jgi:SAM-dependent methyltransferase
MPFNMHVPDTALTYILFQRTGYLRFTNHAFFRAVRKMLSFVSYEKMIALEARLNGERIKADYVADMDQEYQSMKAYLPAACSRVLDIGCGVAGIDVLLRQHYQGHNQNHNQAQELQFFLLDKSQLETRVFYGFTSHGAFYNSLSVAKNVLVVNGIADDHVTTLEASDDNTIAIQDRIDLVISLISWGFHYPVETYVQAVYQLLSEQGRLILDVRKKTDGLALLKDRFSACDVIAEEKKYVRVLCSK